MIFEADAGYVLLAMGGCFLIVGLLGLLGARLPSRLHEQRQREGEFLVRQYLSVKDDLQ